MSDGHAYDDGEYNSEKLNKFDNKPHFHYVDNVVNNSHLHSD